MASVLMEELKSLVQRFEAEGVAYALCGGLAMAVHGAARGTMDIDMLIMAEDLEAALEAARKQGYDFPAAPMEFAQGAVRIRRVSKLIPEIGEHLPLDLLLVTEKTRPAWESRQNLEWEGRSLWAVSRQGLIALKQLRLSSQDKADIEKLEE
jgi:hypothetical protein